MEEPDYDELYDEYIADTQGPPPPQEEFYDEEFLDEAMAMDYAGDDNSPTNGDTSRDNNIPTGQVTGPLDGQVGHQLDNANTMVTSDIANPASDDDSESESDVRQQLCQIRRGQNNSHDLYTFERYNKSHPWREDKSKAFGNDNTMEATKWKKTTTNKTLSLLVSSAANRRLKMSCSPDTQLLTYHKCAAKVFSRKTYSPKKVIHDTKGIRFHPKEGESSVPITLGNGTRIYAKVQQTSPDDNSNQQSTVPSYSKFSKALLGEPISDVMRRVQVIQRAKEHQKSLEKSNTDISNSVSDSTENYQLWVDKHAPSSFTNLLSDERTNREVIRALREWDPFVFKREPPPRPQYGNSDRKKQDSNKANDTPKKNPNDRRPEVSKRVLLLSGPPGVGKTTLAHIAARHVGYRPLEINGSDERSASVLRDRVLRAMESNTLQLTKDKEAARPNCLILDEIDGADARGAIQALVEIITAEMPNNAKGVDDKKSKQRIHKKSLLTRPLIFICNNKYAPSLRPLLPYCRHFHVDPPLTSRLVARLRAVLSSESISCSTSNFLLHQLVNASGGDIRSCLYTLQFASTVSHRKTNDNEDDSGGVTDISTAVLASIQGKGRKDDRIDLAGVTQKAFLRPKTKKARGNSRMKSLNDPRSHVDGILDAVQTFGEYSKILDCLFTNINQVSYIDPTMEKCSVALEWLSSADIYRSSKLAASSNGFINALQKCYVPGAVAAVHLLCRVEQSPDLMYSTRALSDISYKLEGNVGIVQKFADGLSPKVCGRSTKLLSLETIPYSLWVLSAGEGKGALTRPTSSFEILNKEEQKSFSMHVNTLRGLGLIYVSTNNNAGVSSFSSQSIPMMQLEPPIDRIVYFNGLEILPFQQRLEVPCAMKELLAEKARIQGLCKTTSKKSPTAESKQKSKELNLASSASKLKTVATTQTASSKSVKTNLVTDDENNSSPQKTKRNAIESGSSLEARPSKLLKPTTTASPTNKAEVVISCKNFLGIGAKKVKLARSAKKAAMVGLGRSAHSIKGGGGRKSHTGSGVPLTKVIRLKYVKGFTQAVRNPCQLEDLI